MNYGFGGGEGTLETVSEGEGRGIANGITEGEGVL